MSDMMRALVLLDDHGTFEMRDVPVPEIGDDGSVHYSMDADHFARSMGTLLQAGARVIGGCCGTTPAYIEKLRAAYCAML